MKKFFGLALSVMLTAVLATGCGGVRKNVAFFPAKGGATKLGTPIRLVLLPVVDDRENAKIYPKQIVSHTSYYGEKSFEINDRPVEDVFTEALSIELYNMGAGVTRAADINVRLTKDSSEPVRKAVVDKYPEAKVAIGMNITDFMGVSVRNFATTDVKFSAAVQLYVLDLSTGDLRWSDYKTEKTDTVLSADRNYMVEQLDDVLSTIMKKSVRDNMSLRDALVKAANH